MATNVSTGRVRNGQQLVSGAVIPYAGSEPERAVTWISRHVAPDLWWASKASDRFEAGLAERVLGSGFGGRQTSRDVTVHRRSIGRPTLLTPSGSPGRCSRSTAPAVHGCRGVRATGHDRRRSGRTSPCELRISVITRDRGQAPSTSTKASSADHPRRTEFSNENLGEVVARQLQDLATGVLEVRAHQRLCPVAVARQNRSCDFLVLGH